MDFFFKDVCFLRVNIMFCVLEISLGPHIEVVSKPYMFKGH